MWCQRLQSVTRYYIAVHRNMYVVEANETQGTSMIYYRQVNIDIYLCRINSIETAQEGTRWWKFLSIFIRNILIIDCTHYNIRYMWRPSNHGHVSPILRCFFWKTRKNHLKILVKQVMEIKLKFGSRGRVR